MESFLGRYRNLIFLVGVLFLQVLGLAVQVKTGSNASKDKDTRLIRVWAVGAITPFERTVVWAKNGVGDIWHNYFYLRGVRAENRQLKEQIEQMRLEQVRLNEDAAQAHRLQNLLSFKEQFVSKTVAAQVIGSGGSDLSRIIYIDKGEDDGIKRDMAVITADGVVGKVLQVWKTPAVSQVLLISDVSSGVGAILGDSRLQGVVGGTANGEVVLNDVMSDEQVPEGEKVLTSGGDRIYPKGLQIGTVAKVGKGKDLFLSIKVRPSADLSKLEEVLVIVEKQERKVEPEDKAERVRAADILAQRLPSVPVKPKTDETTEGSAKPGTVPPAAGTVKNAPASAIAHNAASAPTAQPKTPSITLAPKPKPANSIVPETKPAATQPPSITEQKPADAPQNSPSPNSPPTADPNSPQ
jgi:rod shape-determining protein MreC